MSLYFNNSSLLWQCVTIYFESFSENVHDFFKKIVVTVKKKKLKLKIVLKNRVICDKLRVYARDIQGIAEKIIQRSSTPKKT